MLPSSLAYTPLIVTYTVEILPYQLRAKGFVLFNFAISLSLIFNQYVNPIALDAIGWKYYIVYCVWIAFELVFVYFFLIETKNRTLEETAVYVLLLLSSRFCVDFASCRSIFDGLDSVRQIERSSSDLEVADVFVDDEKKED